MVRIGLWHTTPALAAPRSCGPETLHTQNTWYIIWATILSTLEVQVHESDGSLWASLGLQAIVSSLVAMMISGGRISSLG